jgi:SAM-dependent methyltransferase
LNKNCQICHGNAVKLLLDYGLQPLSNRYGIKAHDEDYYHSLNIGQCQDCSLIQLITPVPASEIIPRVSWLRYTEEEDHLDSVASIICNLENLPENPIACGITYKDDSLLERLKEKLFKKTFRIDPEVDLGIKQKGVAGETVIPKLNPNSVKKITNKYGYFDVIIARHIMEHAADTQFFLSTILGMLKPEGYIVFEVPDCTKQLKNKDFTMPWEEHILYFVPETFKSSFDHTSFRLSQYCHYSYKKEDVQVAIIQKDIDHNSKDLKTLPDVLTLAEEYAESFENYKKIIHSYFKHHIEKVGKIAFYGAGHDAVIFINTFQIEEFIEYIIDDTEHKQNFYLAGTSLQIKSSETLTFENISLCILCLNINIQDIILEKNKKFISEGGIFTSLYTMQKNSLFNLASNNLKI